jgi:alcohol dehydrogenase (cytochrome c)
MWAATLMLVGCGDPEGTTLGWPAWGNTAGNTHFADLGQINTANVSRLKVVWRRSEGPYQVAWETFPVVVGRTMYYTTDTDEVVAVDAATGRLRWSYLPGVNFLVGAIGGSVEPVNRGVAVGGGRVFELTYDDQLIALDAGSGRREWDVRVANPELGYAETSPGVYWNGEVIIGGPAGDAGLRGFVAAFDAATGRQLWRTYTVPAPGRGWLITHGGNGGGDVWMPPVVDTRSGIVYAATGNPTPAFHRTQRHGCDPWTNATLALSARTGSILWGHTEVCNDAWDSDTSQSPELFSIRVRGHRMPVVGDASKVGFYSVLEARTGALIARSPQLVRYSRPHHIPTPAGVVVCPGNFGGLEYGPAAYSPRTGELYLVGVNMCMRFTDLYARQMSRHTPGASGLGGAAVPVGDATGMIASVDPASGRVVWRDSLPRPAVGGTLATAGGLVLAGVDNGWLYAFDANTGKVLWRADLGLRFGSAPIAYEVGGREFIAIAAGGSSLSVPGEARGGGELFVFALSR